MTDSVSHSETPSHKRRVRYAGKNPRRFEEKYKEHDPERYKDDVAKIIQGGKTPVGTHRPIMVAEILEALFETVDNLRRQPTREFIETAGPGQFFAVVG